MPAPSGQSLPSAGKSEVSLALSGGGVRAMAFHMGVLCYLSDKGWLDRVVRISSVSGGSLITGLIFSANGEKWPTSQPEFDQVLAKVRSIMCSTDLRWAAAKYLYWPPNWRFLLSRANLVERAIQSAWNVQKYLDELPELPAWSINGTVAEDGKRFRFKSDGMGDYEFGYARVRMRLSTALAVSAAFPGGIGPLTIKTRLYTWMKRPYGALPSADRPWTPAFKRLHLYDGGVYDNLGLESLFDAGKGMSKNGNDVIIVSDAGAPLERGFSLWALNPFRFKRISDIMSDQIRSLRVRPLVEHLKRTKVGAYLQMDNALIPKGKSADALLTCSFPTDLCKLTPAQFDAMTRHGYAVAEAVDRAYPWNVQ
ncbi:patatin-like phospholipase family protein [Variovorax sp. YR634]|uniref:patatin-like phospholipase family protein n=1 Tax=Variovorax sp. YR634 TaxID=1884385 RepID=UPI000B865A19|nr:patatin-like phospholipase family protein [Variovorax sp. YR634]